MYAFNSRESSDRHDCSRFLRAFGLACCAIAAHAAVSEGPMECVKEVAAPQFLGNMRGLPAHVEVTVELGASGKATSVTSNTARQAKRARS